MAKCKSLGCSFCPYHIRIEFGYQKGKYICRFKPMYILDRYTRRKPKWCPKRKENEHG